MKQPHAPAVREILRTHPDGLTIHEVVSKMTEKVRPNTIRRVLEERMPDVYIDRWIKGPRGQYQSVWCLAYVPAHCPYPTDRYKPETRWICTSLQQSAQ